MRTSSVSVRLHRSEHEALVAAARARHCSMAELVRRSLRAEIRSTQPSLPFDAVACEHPMSARWQGTCGACGEVLSRLGSSSRAA